MKTTIACVALGLGLSISSSAFADDHYATVMGDYLVKADNKHNPQLKDSIGFDARYGVDSNETWAYEIGAYYDRMKAKRGGHGLHGGVGLDVLYKFGEFGPIKPFLIGGAGPSYADLITGGINEPRGGYSLDAGAGFLAKVGTWMDRPFSARVQAKAAYENYNAGFIDIRVYAGLQFALTAPEPPAPEVVVVPPVEVAPEPVPAVVETPPPAPPVEEPVAVAATDAEPTIETAKEGDKIVLRGVNFEFNKDRLTANAMTILDGVADQLAKRPGLTIEIGGHTDGRGSAKYNQKLSERRAKSVVQYLAGKGIDTGHLTAVGYGMAQPVDTNETDEGREHNRRVELKVTAMSDAPAAAASPAPAEAPAPTH